MFHGLTDIAMEEAQGRRSAGSSCEAVLKIPVRSTRCPTYSVAPRCLKVPLPVSEGGSCLHVNSGGPTVLGSAG